MFCSGFGSNEPSDVFKASIEDTQAQPKSDVKFPDISAIQSESDISLVADKRGSEEKKFESLHRNLMPVVVVHVGDKQVRMPRLDIQRAIALEDRPLFLNNIKNSAIGQEQTLQMQSM